MDGAALRSADGFAKGGTGLGFTQLFLDVIEVGELAQDPANEARRLVFGFEKFPPHMGVAAHEGDVRFVLCPGWVGAVAVALDDAGGGVG